jgi:uncharacterized protein YbcI
MATEEQEQQPTEAEATTSALMEISNSVTRIFKDQFGRGPTRTRAYWAGRDVITVVLEDTLTPAERNLAKMGEHQRLRDIRMFFQYATIRGFCEPVERVTGRKVRAFCSALDTEVDGLSVETFVLHPEGYEDRHASSATSGNGGCADTAIRRQADSAILNASQQRLTFSGG